MVAYCRVFGCTNKSGREKHLTYHRLPKVITNQGEECQKLSEERRRLWLVRLNQDLRGKNVNNVRICSAHFLSGKKSGLYQKDNPDWVPSVGMTPPRRVTRQSTKEMRKLRYNYKYLKKQRKEQPYPKKGISRNAPTKRPRHRKKLLSGDKDQQAEEAADTVPPVEGTAPHRGHWDYWDYWDHSYSSPPAGAELTCASSAERVPIEHDYWTPSLPPPSRSSVGEQKPIKEEQEELWEYQEVLQVGEMMAFIVKSEDEEEPPQGWQLWGRQREEKMTKDSDGEVTDCSEDDSLTSTASESYFMNNNHRKKKKASHKVTDSTFIFGKTFNSFSESEISYSKKKKTTPQSKGSSTYCLRSDSRSAVRRTSGKPFSCDVCFQNFVSKSNLNQHMMLHTRENSFGQKFTKKSLRLAHTRVHTGLKPYKCDVCSKCFRWKQTLTSHMKVHTGKKPYGCDICGKVFALKNTLIKHMISHTIQNPI